LPALTPTAVPFTGNLATKRNLVADAQALARNANGETDPRAMSEILTAWASTDPAGAGHDGKLWWELKQACASFYDRCGAEAFGATP